MHNIVRLFAAGLIAALSQIAVSAQTFEIHGVASFDILHGYRTDDGHHMAAARIRMAEGWKTYWRQPGGNGIPPRFTFGGTRNVAAVQFHWPQPTVFVDRGDRVLGYERELVLPIELRPAERGRDIRLKGRIEFGLCEEICIPAVARFNATLSAKGAGHRQAIDTALDRRPRAARGAEAHCDLRPVDDGFNVTVALRLPMQPGQGVFAVIGYPGDNIWVDLDRVARTSSGLDVTATLYDFSDGPFLIDRSKFTFSVFDQGGMVEIQGCSAG